MAARAARVAILGRLIVITTYESALFTAFLTCFLVLFSVGHAPFPFHFRGGGGTTLGLIILEKNVTLSTNLPFGIPRNEILGGAYRSAEKFRQGI